MIDWIGAALVHVWISYLLTGPALGTLFFFGILFEHNEHRGWAIFMALVAAVIAFFKFDVSLLTLGACALGYIVLGLVWSFFRYRRHAVTEVERINNIKEDDYYFSRKQDYIENLHPAHMWDTIIAWVIVWPFSFIANFIGDILNGIQTLVKTVFRGVYVKIYESAIAGLNLSTQKED